jgi:glycosyltransferase involved in cell wall biosynthesis
MAGKLKLIWIGELVPRKNIEVLLDSLRGLTGFELTIIGDGPQMSHLKVKYDDLIKNNLITFTGRIPRDEVFRCLKSSNVLVHTSYREGTATTIVEGIANGNFIVAIDIGGHSCLINKTTGILLPLTRREELVENLKNKLKFIEENRHLLNQQKVTWTWEKTITEITKNYV